MRKLTIEHVQGKIAEYGCQYIGGVYDGCDSILQIKCRCGEVFNASWDKFKQGQRKCQSCNRKSIATAHRLTEEQFRNIYYEKNCVPLITHGEYERITQRVPYICNICGNHGMAMIANFKYGGCKGCGKRMPFEKVRMAFEKSGCMLLETEYHDAKRPMRYICSCGNESKIDWSNFSQGKRCARCRESYGERSISTVLSEWGQDYVREARFPSLGRMRFDFHLPKFNNLFEYQGQQHYFPVAFSNSKEPRTKIKNLIGNIKRDHKKLSFCVQHKIPLLLIPFWDIDRIPEILDDLLHGKEPTFSEPPEIVKKYEPMRKKIRDKLKISETEVLCGLIKVD